jgi:hypothetical protein
MVTQLRLRMAIASTNLAGADIDVELFMAESPNDAAGCSNVFANNVTGTELNALTRKEGHAPACARPQLGCRTVLLRQPVPLERDAPELARGGVRQQSLQLPARRLAVEDRFHLCSAGNRLQGRQAAARASRGSRFPST